MKGTKFFGGIALASCVFVLLLAFEAGFISVALAAGKTTQYPGYAKLRDADGDKIKSDGLGQYVDTKLGGNDYVKLTIENNSGDLFRSDITIGLYGAAIIRRVLIDLSNPTPLVAPDSTEGKFLAILLETPSAAYLQVAISIPGAKPLMVYVALGKDDITRGALRADPWNIDPAELEKYQFTNGKDGIPGTDDDHLKYFLGYEGSTVTEVVEGKTWTIVPYGSPVKLYVYKKKSKTVWEPVYLATYVNMPFGYTTSTSSLEAPGAPRKQSTLSANWGKIKAK